MGIAAIIASAVVGAGATMIASGNASSAAKQSAQVQADAADRSADVQQGIFNQTRNDLSPFRVAGTGALGNLAGLLPGGLTVTGTDADGNPISQTLGSTPDASLAGLRNFSPGGAQSGTGYLSNAVSAAPGALGGFIPGSGNPLNTTAQGLMNLIPGGTSTPNPLLLNLQSYLPGNGTVNPVTQGLLNLTPGALETPNPMLQAIGSFIPGFGPDSAMDPTLKALRGFIPGTGNENPLLQQYNALLGVGGDPASVQAALESTPGYKFTRDQGLKSVQNSYAAKGLGSSGAALRGAGDYVTGLADQTYETRLNDYLNSYNSQFTNTYNAYQGQFGNALNTYNNLFTNSYNANAQLFNNGLNTYNNLFANSLNANNAGFNNALNLNNTNFSNALNLNNSNFTNSVAGYNALLTGAQNLVNTGANSGAQVGTIGATTGGNVGAALTSAGAAQAAGIVGASNAQTNALTGIASNVGNAAVTAALLRDQRNGLSLTGPGGSVSPALLNTAGGTQPQTGIYGR